MLFIHPSQLLIYLVMMMSLSWPCGPPPEATESQHQKTYYLLHLYSLTRSEMIKSTEHNWWKFSRAMRYIITDISSCYHHPHSPAIRASSLLQLLSCQSPVAHHISPGWAFKDGRLEEISNMENALMQQPSHIWAKCCMLVNQPDRLSLFSVGLRS